MKFIKKRKGLFFISLILALGLIMAVFVLADAQIFTPYSNTAPAQSASVMIDPTAITDTTNLKYTWSTIDGSDPASTHPNSGFQDLPGDNTCTKSAGNGDWYLWVRTGSSGGYTYYVSGKFVLDNTAPARPVITAQTVSGGGTVTIPAVTDGNTAWLAKAGTSSFTPNVDMTCISTDGATTMTAPAVSGNYRLYLVDPAGNVSQASTDFVKVDATAPTATVKANHTSPTNLNSLTYTIQFSEAVTGFEFSDITVTNGTTDAMQFTAVDADTYKLVVTYVGDGDQTVAIAAGVCQDGVGNQNAAASATVIMDKTAPNVTITPGAASPSSANPMLYTITFSEDVTGFADGDVRVVNGTKSAVNVFTAIDARTYTIGIDYKADGNQTININAGSCKDAAGNNNTPGSVSVFMDRTKPAASVTAASQFCDDPVTTARSTELGTVYLVSDTVAVTDKASLDAAVTAGTASKAAVAAVNTDTTIVTTGLAAGTYYVYSTDVAGNVSNASAGTITLVAHTYTLSVGDVSFSDVVYGYAQPAAQGLTITSSGNTDATISSVTSGNAAFVIGGSGATVPFGTVIDTWTVQPATGLAVGTYTGTVTVTYNNNATATATVSMNVTKAPLTVSADNKTITYGDALPTYTATAADLQNGDTVSSLGLTFTTSPAAPVNVGTYPIAPLVTNATALANYDISYTNGTLTIEKAELTVKADDLSKIYGSNNPTLTYSITGYVNGETSAVVSGSPKLTCTATKKTAVSASPVTISLSLNNLSAANYKFKAVNGALTINKAPMTVTATGPQKVYGMALNQIDGILALAFTTYSGTVNGEIVTKVTLTPDAAGASATTAAGATYSVTPSNATGTLGFNANNYAINYVAYNGTVAKRPLGVTVLPVTMKYGEAVPTLKLVGVGLVNGDTLDTLSITAVTSATSTSSVGFYPITINHPATLANYEAGYLNGVLVITPADLTVKADDKSMTYGASLPALTATTTGLVGGDTLTSLGITLTTAGGSASTVGTYQITVNHPDQLENYHAVYTNGTLTIGKATPIISWSNPADTTFGTALDGTQLNATAKWTVSGVEAAVDGTYAYTPDAGTVLDAGAGQTLGVVFTPTDTTNYMTASSSVQLNVSQKDISGYKIDAISYKIYTGKEIKPTVTVPGLTSSDFDVAFENNIMPGTATVKVTGKGNYTGILTTTFSIFVLSPDQKNVKASGVSELDVTTVYNVTTVTATLTGNNFDDEEGMQSIIETASAFEADNGVVVVKLYNPEAKSGTQTFTVKGAQLAQFASGSDAALEIGGPVGSVMFDAAALDSIVSQSAGSDLSVTIAPLSDATIASQYPAYAGKPVYDISVMAGATKLTTFGGGEVTVTMPYTPAAGEDINNIVIYYLSASGDVLMQNCVYDPVTKTVSFTTTHLSVYGVKDATPTAYSDVSGWYAGYVTYLSDRGIMTGTEAGKFSPDMTLSRAQFVKILANLAGADLSKYTTSHFTDVSTSDWYFGAVEWAFANGITKGIDGKFKPEDAISRQDIALMLQSYAKLVGFTLPQTVDAKTFTDSAAIASYAKDAVTAMQLANIISGKSDGSFAPTSGATRAEAAKMVAAFMQLMIQY
ncbi:MBG domain-containing protein [Oscillospiraceae bacterium WX1]